MDPFADLCMGCEKKATLRCPPCTKAGQDTKFCSKECQKVMWLTHRTYCGKGKQLFFHPALLREEFDSFVEIAVKNQILINDAYGGRWPQARWTNLLRLCTDGLKASPPNCDQAWESWTLHENDSKWQVEVLTSCMRAATGIGHNALTAEAQEENKLHPYITRFSISTFYLDVDESSSEEWLKVNSDFLYCYVNCRGLDHNIRNRIPLRVPMKSYLNLWERVHQQFEKVKMVSNPGPNTLECIEHLVNVAVILRQRDQISQARHAQSANT